MFWDSTQGMLGGREPGFVCLTAVGERGVLCWNAGLEDKKKGHLPV
jgi:hypothetical protein